MRTDNYKNDTMIRKEAYVLYGSVLDELRRIIEDGEIMQEDEPNMKQRIGNLLATKENLVTNFSNSSLDQMVNCDTPIIPTTRTIP